MDIQLLIALLPFFFMLHDFEEIIMFRPWLDKNRDEIRRRFTFIDKLLQRNHDRLTTSAYAVAVLFEFLVVALATYLSLYFHNYLWWFAAFSAFSLHLLVHIGQWAVYRKYVPVVITSFLALPYCFFTFSEFQKIAGLTGLQLFFWAFLGIALGAASFIPAFLLAAGFEKWKNRNYLSRVG